MNKKIAAGASLLLTLGCALGGTVIYGSTDDPTEDVVTLREEQVPTPYTIAMWKATASSTNYVVPRVPL